MQRVDARVAHYQAQGFGRGERVFIHFGNCNEFFVELLAAWRVGGCVVPIDRASPRSRSRLLRRGRSLGSRSGTSSLPDESKALLAGADFRPVELELRARGMPCVLLKKLGASGDRSIGGVPAVAPAHLDIRLIDSMSG